MLLDVTAPQKLPEISPHKFPPAQFSQGLFSALHAAKINFCIYTCNDTRLPVITANLLMVSSWGRSRMQSLWAALTLTRKKRLAPDIWSTPHDEVKPSKVITSVLKYLSMYLGRHGDGALLKQGRILNDSALPVRMF